ncbi:MAG: ECF transporter S component [Peptoniphilaceae bacterium]
MSKIKSRDVAFIGICIAINIIGAFIAVSTKVPLLLDHIGTMMICMMFGWKIAVSSAFVSSCLVTMLFDPYALPFAPTGMIMISVVGIFLDKGVFKKLGTIPAMTLAVLPGAILGAIIAGYIFGGVTSSGSSIIVRLFINLGLNEAFSVFIIQYFMELADRILSFYVVKSVIKRINY